MDRASLVLRILYMNEEVKTPKIIKILILVAFVSMVLIIFLQQLKVPFMLEDLDYAKNLVTGEPLKSFDDISQSLGCIFFWKGGSLVAGFFLQLLLLSGGYVADFVNMLVMLLCSFLIFAPTKRSHQRMFFSVFSFLLLIALNVDWNNSYFRQFGAVNFFYPSVIMLALLNICAKIVDNNDDYKTLGIVRTIVLSVAGFMAGVWSPSYGVMCSLILGSVIFYRSKVSKDLQNAGFVIALFFSVIGVILYLVCPGNYTDGSVLTTKFISADVYPSVVSALLVLAIFLRMGGQLKPSQYLKCSAMLYSVVLCLLCVFVLPIAPNGTLLCTMVLGISTFCSLFYSLNKIVGRYRIYGYVLCSIALLYDVFVILESQLGVE